MKTALDSSVLLTLFNGEPGADQWMDLLIQARKEGPLLACEIVYAEVTPAFAKRPHLKSAHDRLGVRFDPIHRDSAWLAGQTFKAYRQAGGPCEHLIPDFLIAAHALVQADRLAAIDRGYFRSYFPDLILLKHSGE